MAAIQWKRSVMAAGEASRQYPLPKVSRLKEKAWGLCGSGVGCICWGIEAICIRLGGAAIESG